MYSLKKSKKGSIEDVVLIAVLLTFFAIVVLIGFKVGSEFDEKIQVDSAIPTEAKDASTKLLAYYPGVIDNSFLFLTIGLAIAAIILAAMVKIHPIFIVFFIIALILVIFLSAVLSNIYQEMAANPELSAQADQMTIMSYIMSYLPFFVGIFGILIMIVLYKLGTPGQ